MYALRCSDILIIKTEVNIKVWKIRKVWKILSSELSAGRQGYTNSVGLWGPSDAGGDSRYVRVLREQSTITKMHWLKLDPYRYQTES